MVQKLEQVSISKLKPNPFRELDDYPIDREKVDKLKESITMTGFWGTIVARKSGGDYEIAFGHHRRIALQELQDEGVIGAREKVDIIVRELSNEEMLQLMARENLEEWGTNAYIEAQTVESTIRAYGAGEIELPEVPVDTKKQYERRAPGSGGTYTMASVASFLGWTKADGQPNHACNVAFQTLDAFEAGIVTRKELQGVSRELAHSIVQNAMGIKREQERVAAERRRKAKEAEELATKEADAVKARKLMQASDKLEQQAELLERKATERAKEFAKDSVKQVKSGNWSVRDVRESGAEQRAAVRSKKEQQYKTASEYYGRLRKRVCEFLNKRQDEEFSSLVQLLKVDCGLTQDDIDTLKPELQALSNRIDEFVALLDEWEPKADKGSDSLLRIVG